ncbi:MAG TPA: hypothetical protein VLL54_09920 [Pyrinomonadaceae bacterium]|nr:hypothetical protein [Pyrinomonadaceae bacterium]
MQAKIRRLLCLSLIVVSISSVAIAAVELSGTWKLNIEKSSFGGLSVPSGRTFNITQRGTMLKIEVTDKTPSGERTQVLECTTDGAKCVNNVRGQEFRSTVHWEGSELVFETEGSLDGSEFRAVDQWTISEDGKTITINRHASNNIGEVHQKLVLEKQ